MQQTTQQPTVSGDVVIRHYTEHQRLLYTPEAWIGSALPIERDEYIYDFQSGRIVSAKISVAPAIVQLFNEVLANTIDNASRSRRACVDPGVIVVNVDQYTVSVYNEGVPLPVVVDEECGLLKPTMTFGMTGTSSNYTEIRHEAGRNGLGVKATNIWSKEFTAEVVDATRQLSYTQKWRDNMTVASEPQVSQVQTDKSWVRVTYLLDFQHAGIPCYPEEIMALFARHCADASFTSKVPVYYNQIPMIYGDIKRYSQLYFGNKATKSLTYRSYPNESMSPEQACSLLIGSDGFTLPAVEVLALDTPHEALTIGFVNGLMTPDGGVHVDEATRAITSKLIKTINASKTATTKPEPKPGKPKSSGTTTTGSSGTTTPVPKLTIRDVRNHVSLIVSVRVINPQWAGQTKSALKGPAVKVKLPPSLLEQVKTWKLVETLKAALKEKQAGLLTMTGGSKKRFLGSINGTDANEAGGPNSESCTMIIVEGKSAENYATIVISQLPGGRDYTGVLPIRGKLRNAIKSEDEQMAANKEICEIVTMLGLVYGTDYSSPWSRGQLRYGRLMLMMDADDDGHHIKSLLLAFFNKYFPSLIACGFIVDYRTPCIRVKKGTMKDKFYFIHDYDLWKSQNQDWDKWTHKYLKGLGSSSKKDAIEDSRNLYIVGFLYDEHANSWMQLAFHRKHTDARKRWIFDYQAPVGLMSNSNYITVSDFVQNVLIIYSKASIRRHIPQHEDALKRSQRKVLYAAFQKWGLNPRAPREYRIGLFASYTIERTKYHHGDGLSDVIVSMAQDFVGSNNLPYFTQESMLGTRNKGGKDAAQPRYTGTKPSWWLPYVYTPDDVKLLKHLEDEGDKIEYEHYLPILPMHLINGVTGIATAWCTMIPNHHPLAVVRWLQARIMGAVREVSEVSAESPALPGEWFLPVLVPWYRGFRGSIEIVDRTKVDLHPELADLPDTDPRELPNATEVYNDGEDEDQQRDQARTEGAQSTPLMLPVEAEKPDPYSNLMTYGSKRSHFSMVTRGIYEIDEIRDVITVTELPIGTWTENYKEWLIQLQTEKRITSYRNNSSDVGVHFEIYGFKPSARREAENRRPTERDLHLAKSYSMSNMILTDKDMKPHRYANVREIMEAFYKFRLPYYEIRRLDMISKYRGSIAHLQGKMDFIRAVQEGRLATTGENGRGRSTAAVYADMDRLGLQRRYLRETNFENVMEEDTGALAAEIEEMLAKITKLEGSHPGQLWLDDLTAFENAYNRHYKGEVIRVATNDDEETESEDGTPDLGALQTQMANVTLVTKSKGKPRSRAKTTGKSRGKSTK